MMIKRSLFLLTLPMLFIATSLNAQKSAEIAVKSVITSLFEGMKAGDTTAIVQHLHPQAELWTSLLNADGEADVRKSPISAWLNGVATAPAGSLDERLLSIQVQVDSDRMASAWTPYEFWLNGSFSHCGTNHFQLAKVGNQWLITSIIDTRNKEGCVPLSDQISAHKTAINTLMDNWHEDAAKGRFEAYFSKMSEDSWFLGTDASEVWDKQSFMDFSEPHFADGEGWSFTATRRAIYLSEDQRYAWFDEDLDTWMGVCRGSGIVSRENNQWKLKHYVLSVAVPNDLVNDYLLLFEK